MTGQHPQIVVTGEDQRRIVIGWARGAQEDAIRRLDTRAFLDAIAVEQRFRDASDEELTRTRLDYATGGGQTTIRLSR